MSCPVLFGLAMRALHTGNKQLINFCGHGRLPRKTRYGRSPLGTWIFVWSLSTTDDVQTRSRYNVGNNDCILPSRGLLLVDAQRAHI